MKLAAVETFTADHPMVNSTELALWIFIPTGIVTLIAIVFSIVLKNKNPAIVAVILIAGAFSAVGLILQNDESKAVESLRSQIQAADLGDSVYTPKDRFAPVDYGKFEVTVDGKTITAPVEKGSDRKLTVSFEMPETEKPAE